MGPILYYTILYYTILYYTILYSVHIWKNKRETKVKKERRKESPPQGLHTDPYVEYCTSVPYTVCTEISDQVNSIQPQLGTVH